MAWTNLQKAIFRDIEIEIKVKGPRTVAEELEVSEGCIRELFPDLCKQHDEAAE